MTSEDSELQVLGLKTMCNLSLEETNRKALTEVEALEQHPIMQNKNLEQADALITLMQIFLSCRSSFRKIPIMQNENPGKS